MSTAVDFEQDAALMAAATGQTFRSCKAKTYLAARVIRSICQRPPDVHRGGQMAHERALVEISPPAKEVGDQASIT